jgi:hypothetical protein
VLADRVRPQRRSLASNLFYGAELLQTRMTYVEYPAEVPLQPVDPEDNAYTDAMAAIS